MPSYLQFQFKLPFSEVNSGVAGALTLTLILTLTLTVTLLGNHLSLLQVTSSKLRELEKSAVSAINL